MKTLTAIAFLVSFNVYGSSQIVVFPVLNCTDQRGTYLNVELDVSLSSKMEFRELIRVACLNIDRLEHEDKRVKRD